MFPYADKSNSNQAMQPNEHGSSWPQEQMSVNSSFLGMRFILKLTRNPCIQVNQSKNPLWEGSLFLCHLLLPMQNLNALFTLPCLPSVWRASGVVPGPWTWPMVRPCAWLDRHEHFSLAAHGHILQSWSIMGQTQSLLNGCPRAHLDVIDMNASHWLPMGPSCRPPIQWSPKQVLGRNKFLCSKGSKRILGGDLHNPGQWHTSIPSLMCVSMNSSHTWLCQMQEPPF